MAYTHSKYEVEMVPYTGSATGASDSTPSIAINGAWISVTGTVAQWAPGMVPHLIRGAAVKQTATVLHANGVVIGFEADITTPGTPTRLFTITLPTVGSNNAIFKVPTYQVEIKPGQIVSANVTAAATAGVGAKIILYVEPRWEHPTNVTGMLSTT